MSISVKFIDGRVEEINADHVRQHGDFWVFIKNERATLASEYSARRGPWPWGEKITVTEEREITRSEWVDCIRVEHILRMWPTAKD